MPSATFPPRLCSCFDVYICFLQTCEQAGEDLVPCEGQCCGMFHLNCLGPSLKPDEKLLCQECSTGELLFILEVTFSLHSITS